MSEYWKSTPKYWCKHCSIYVKDTPFERKQHENTGKHQGNLKRFLRGIQNDHERNEREKQKVKDEVERLNRVVGASSTNSVPAALTSSQAPSRKHGSSNLTAVDQKRQWAQLAEMGISVPENFRGEMAMSGDWQTVSQKVTEESSPQESLSKGVRKRKLEDQDVEEEYTSGTTERRGWGASTRRYPGQQTEDDLDSLLQVPIVRKDDVTQLKTEQSPVEQRIVEASDYATETAPHALESRTDTFTGDVKNAPEEGLATKTLVKEEERESNQSILLESEQDTTGVPIFKKRKGRTK